MAEAKAMIGSFELSMDVNDLADRVVNETGIIDLLQRCMCHFAELYASQVLGSVANYYICGADARFILVGPPPFEPVARYLMDGLLMESRCPWVADFAASTLEDEEELHMWSL